ncbi:phosphoadenosine phosphosulfate reductase [Turneriella parva DSM 21527]|uniref:Phosphoadenosine phosphosulfate reductase n=1 Tax=Turneriella parva (strain ATCC BAA-1111 / DSM 21527 / NCTC 11395 / H) TaxID=869212 RepID=I4B6P8_TURPD|nr:phosphoadenosine phosphosulfate reductase [Turneriella parva DSM 21527]
MSGIVPERKVRHILGISGGKDSAALAVYMRDRVPDIEYFFCDTGEELTETYDFIDRLEARLGIKVQRLAATQGFKHFLEKYNDFLPSPQSRWCTVQMKIKPLEEFIGDDEAISYVAIRADEDRSGYVATKDTIKVVFPFKDAGITKPDVERILEESGIGMPKYYSWRSRSGCYFCFFQRKIEWVRLAENHPGLFEKAKSFEKVLPDGRRYTWSQDESLDELIARKDQIIAEHEKRVKLQKQRKPNKTLAEVLEGVLDGEDQEEGCVVCHV